MKSFFGAKLEQVFWFVVLLSWVPLIASYSILPSLSQIDSEVARPILLPEPIFLSYPPFNLLAVLFLLCIPISLTLRKRFVVNEREKYLAKTAKRSVPDEEHARIKRKRPRYLIAALPLLLAGTIPYFANSAPFNNLTGIFFAVYLASFVVSVALYLRHAHLISSAFVIFSGVLLFDSISIYLSNQIQYAAGPDATVAHYSIFGTIFDLYYTDILKVLLFVFGAALIRMIYLVYRDNRGYLKGKDRKLVFGQITGTFRLWYPMLLIFAVFSLAYQLLYVYKLEPAMIAHIVGCVGEPIPAEENDGHTPKCPEDLNNEDGTPLTLEQAMQQTNTRKLAQLNERSNAKISAYKSGITDWTDQAPDQVYQDLNTALPKRMPGTKTRDCGIDIILCPIGNAIKSGANSSYNSAKRRQLKKIRRELTDISNDAKLSTEEKAKKIQEALDKSLTQLEQVNRTVVGSSFASFQWLSRLLFIYSLIILIKTFMIVFSRISFARDTPDTASFKTSYDADAFGDIKNLGAKFKLPKTDKRTYYFARKSVTVTGPPMDRFTPIRFMGFFTRLFNGKLALNRVAPSIWEGDVEVSNKPPAVLLRWDLKKHERVFFSFADFAGMSDDITIERRVSLSVSTLIFGQTIHYCAVGPGRLYLQTKAIPAIVKKGTPSASQNSSKLVAWNVSTAFNVLATKNIVNTFMSDSNVEPCSEDERCMIIFDLDHDRGQSRSAGILQFAKSFLLPV